MLCLFRVSLLYILLNIDIAGVCTVRGVTCLKNVWNLHEGFKYVLKFNAMCQPVGEEAGLLE